MLYAIHALTVQTIISLTIEIVDETGRYVERK
jgi:hypothetical protein